MYRVPTHKIRTGMKLARTITLDNNRNYLVAGAVLRESYIGLLLKHGITSVYVVNEVAPDVVPPDVVRPETRAEMTRELRAVVREIEATFRKAGDRAFRRLHVEVDLTRLKRCVDKMVSELLSQPTVVYNLTDIRRADDATLDHSVNVSILSALLGAEVGYPPADLKDLALGALLHDIGKVTTPEEILKKPGPLTPEEFEIMTCHTVDGWEILRRQRDISPRVSIVALQHHERWQGGGYPYGLAGQEIYRFSRICAIVDCFDSLTADRVYQPGLPSAEALRKLVDRMAGYFEPSLLWNFTQCVAPYPVGSLVELSGGVQAVVVRTTRKQTYRPRVRLVRRPDGTPYANPVELDLIDHPELQIVRVITEFGETLATGDPPSGAGLTDQQSTVAT
ncbi:MAG TPA: HD-GYP domain-containing protein [Symbiobacteriaceae bacterium]